MACIWTAPMRFSRPVVAIPPATGGGACKKRAPRRRPRPLRAPLTRRPIVTGVYWLGQCASLFSIPCHYEFGRWSARRSVVVAFTGGKMRVKCARRVVGWRWLARRRAAGARRGRPAITHYWPPIGHRHPAPPPQLASNAAPHRHHTFCARSMLHAAGKHDSSGVACIVAIARVRCECGALPVRSLERVPGPSTWRVRSAWAAKPFPKWSPRARRVFIACRFVAMQRVPCVPPQSSFVKMIMLLIIPKLYFYYFHFLIKNDLLLFQHNY